MERIKNVMQRLQELYFSRHQKTAIDIDLMLDYTRVMYADLLEWRKQFKDEVPFLKEDADKNMEGVREGIQADAGKEGTVAPAAAEAIVKVLPEAESIQVLQEDSSGISFEPPVAAEHKVAEPEAVIVTEVPVVTPAVEDKAVPVPELEEQAASSVTPAVLPFIPGLPRDIRSSIGINDKYLYLNELFNNHKSNYEEALDQLNQFGDYSQANDWIWTKVAAPNNWDERDETVQSFFSTLEKHFSAR